jgi:hypothetical protein
VRNEKFVERMWVTYLEVLGFRVLFHEDQKICGKDVGDLFGSFRV